MEVEGLGAWPASTWDKAGREQRHKRKVCMGMRGYMQVESRQTEEDMAERQNTDWERVDVTLPGNSSYH